MSEAKFKPVTAITMGDPAGIGPEIVVGTMLDEGIHECCKPFVIGSIAILDRAAKVLGKELKYNKIEDPSEAKYEYGTPSAHETVLHNHAVLSSLSSDFFNPVQYCLAVFCRRLDNVIVQVRPRRVNIGIAFILGFQSFVVIAYPADSTELTFFYAHNRVICHRHFSPYRFIFKEVIIQNVSLNYLPLYHFAENGRND